MTDKTKHDIKLSELEMRLIKETIETASYLGIHSDTVSAIRRKMKIKKDKK